MKKLLEILGTIIIGGGGILTLVANSPAPPQEQQTKLESSEINYSQTNDLEKLNRNKRQNNNNGLNVGKSLNVSWNSTNYFASLLEIFKELVENNVFYKISGTIVDGCNTTNYYVINNKTYNYFVVSVNVENQENKINLIFGTSDLYIQGFTYNTTYYHFPNINNIREIPNYTSRSLGFSENYATLIGNSNPETSWTGITQAFNNLINYGENPAAAANRGIIEITLARVAWATAESMRFNSVRALLRNSNTTSFFWSALKALVVRTWERTTTNAINYLRDNNNGNLNNFSNNQALNPSRILVFTARFLAILNLNPCNNRNPRSLNSNLMCYKNSSMIDISSLEWEIDELDPYYEYHGPGDINNDYFRVKGRWGHDLVEFKMSLKTAIAFKNFFYNNKKNKAENYLKNLINSVEQKNETWWTGYISDDDKDLIKNFIFDGYFTFHDKLLELIDAENKDPKNNSIFVKTWRTYNWKNLTKEEKNNAFYINKNNMIEKNNNHDELFAFKQDINNFFIYEIKDINDNGAVFVRTTNGEAYYLNGLGKWKYTVPFPVTTIYRFEKGGFGRSAGDVYFGTTNGVYLAKMGSWRADTKINGIDEEIVSIQTDRGHENSVHIKTISGKVCFMDANGTIGWYNIPYPVTSIYRFEKGDFGRSAGDVYFGTTNGIYLSTAENNWINPSKINNGINNAVAEIKDANDNYNSVFVRTNNGEAYYLNGRGELSKYNVPFPVTTIYRFEKSGAGRNVGDVYFGTTNGVYLAKMGSWRADTKINGIDEEIVSIQTDRGHENSVHIKTISGKVCFMDANGTIGWYNIPYPVTSIYRFEKGTGKYGINDGDVYVGTSNGLYLSKAGNNWNTISKIELAK